MSVFSNHFSFNETTVRSSRSKYGYPISVQFYDRGFSEGEVHLDLKHAVRLVQELTKAIAHLHPEEAR